MRRNRATLTRGALVLVPILSFVTVGKAETLNFGVDAGVSESDNVTLARDDKVSQTIAVTDFDVDYKEKSQRLDFSAKGSGSYLDYLQKAYGNEFLGRFDGSAEFALIPQRLTWTLQDNFGQAAIDPFTPTIPTNLEDINYVATGPDLYLRFGGASFIDLSARVAHTQYATSPFSNSRALGSLAWGVKLSPLSSVSVNADTQRVLFDNTVLNTDFERSNVFGRYELQGSRSDLSADLGATVVGESGGSTTGGLAKFKWERKLSAAARLTLTLGHDVTDGSTSFSGLQAGATGVVGTAPATNTPQNYTSNYGSVGWDYQRYRTTLGLSGRWERDVYAGEPALDRTLTTGELRVQRQMTRAFALQITGRLYKSDYGNANAIVTNGSPNTETGSIAASLSWRHGRALEVKFACEHTTYTTSPNDSGYRENRVFLTVGYRPMRAAPVGGEAPGT